MSTPPFTRPLPVPDCPAAWAGGSHTAAVWLRSIDGQLLPRGAVHALLRAAGLPVAELLYMGATRAMLAPRLAPLPAADVAPVLGRIVLDAEETLYDDSWAPWAAMIGAAVIKEWFPHAV